MHGTMVCGKGQVLSFARIGDRNLRGDILLMAHYASGAYGEFQR
ncbi:hypothetical protein [Novosphingobium malaysiense]|nr:hypothetical protein [Novosphingobium malaysiense]